MKTLLHSFFYNSKLLVCCYISFLLAPIFSFGQQKETDSVRYQKAMLEWKRMDIDGKVYALKGKEFPAFVLSDLDGYSIDSRSLKGKTTIINFWDVNCQSCINVMQPLNDLREKYKDEVNFISITADTQKDVLEFLEWKNFNFKHILAPRSYLQNFGMFVNPKTFLLDQDFKVVEIFGQMKFVGEEFKSKQEEYQENISVCLKELMN